MDERKGTNVLCRNGKYELYYKGDDAYDLLIFFAKNIIDYCIGEYDPNGWWK